jgi:hypothetical protein
LFIFPFLPDTRLKQEDLSFHDPIVPSSGNVSMHKDDNVRMTTS